MSNTRKHQNARKYHKLIKQNPWRKVFEALSTDAYNQLVHELYNIKLDGVATRYGNKRKRVAFMKVAGRRAKRKSINREVAKDLEP